PGQGASVMKCLLFLAVLFAGMWYLSAASVSDEHRMAAASQELLAAATRGDADAIRLLLAQAVATINVRDDAGNDPLLLAAISGRAEAVKLLLSAGASPDIRNPFGATPLMMACLFARNQIA